MHFSIVVLQFDNKQHIHIYLLNLSGDMTSIYYFYVLH